MAFKVQVLDDRSRPTGEKLKRSVAELMVRRLLADWITPKVSIRRRRIAQVNLSALPRPKLPRHLRRPRSYEHHIEPKLQAFTIANSDWQRYLEGWGGAQA